MYNNNAIEESNNNKSNFKIDNLEDFNILPIDNKIFNQAKISNALAYGIIENYEIPFIIIYLIQNKIYYSSYFLKLLEVKNDENEKITDIIYNKFSNEFFDQLNVFIANNKEFEKKISIPEFKYKKSVTTLNCHLSKIYESNEPCLILIFQTNFELENVEKNYTEKLSEKEKQQSIFLENISHEIRTPLNSILGFTELLTIKDFKPEQINEYLEIIKTKSRSLLNFLDDLIELTRLETHNISFVKTTVYLPKLFQELHREYLQIVSNTNSNVELFLNISSENEISHFITDGGRLFQVMQYLLENALNHTQNGYIQFGYELKDAKNILFFIRDTGSGFSKQQQRLLFDKIKMKDDTPDKQLQLCDLKPLIARLIVEQLGGKMVIESNPGQGCYLYFNLPYQKVLRKQNYHEKEQLVHYIWKNKIILIAEDDITNYQFIEAILSDTQVQLIHVENGQQAIEMCKIYPQIDLVLMDIKMPEKNGYEAIKEIKQIRNIPIIVQSAYSSRESIERCKKLGCDEYITKPLDIKQLIKLINKYLTE